MNILDLAYELGLQPKRAGSTNGGEYKSKCPKCQAGTDRFCIWPKQGRSGRYWCRVCRTNGDGIQFCRDFFNMNFHQACQKTNYLPQPKLSLPPTQKTTEFRRATIPSLYWQQAASEFITSAQKNLLNEPAAIAQLEKRGLNIQTIKQFRLGWNPDTLFRPRETWGLPSEMKENGSSRRQWLPNGIVIPSFSGTAPVKIKIRRSDWIQGDALPKYVEIAGSGSSLSIYGDLDKPIIIVESELDAILIQQEASDHVCSIALGGVGKKPDADIHGCLKKSPRILLSLDFDEAGKKNYSFWMKTYPNLCPWPSSTAKSAGEIYQLFHLDLLSWVKLGLHSS